MRNNRCKAIKDNGKRCLNNARQRGYCLIHYRFKFPPERKSDLDKIPEGKRGTIKERMQEMERLDRISKINREMDGRREYLDGFEAGRTGNKIKLFSDYEKKAFLYLFEGFITTLLWICILGLMQITTNIKVYGWYSIFPVLNFVGFELYFLWLIIIGKIKEIRERW